MQDIIKREIIIKASKQRIYAAIATAEQVVLWFPDTIEGEYSVGNQPIFGFGQSCRNQLYIVDAKPHEYFAYRWVPGEHDFIGDVRNVPNTLVEFRIDEQSAGCCKVTLIETGFAGLPAELIKTALEQNSGGWDYMLDRLIKYFEAA